MKLETIKSNKRLKFKKGQTEQINTCSKFTIETLEEGGKCV